MSIEFCMGDDFIIDFLVLKEVLSNGFLCYSLVDHVEIVILFCHQIDEFYYYQRKQHYSCILLHNDFLNYELKGFAVNCSSPLIVNNEEFVDLYEEFCLDDNFKE